MKEIKLDVQIRSRVGSQKIRQVRGENLIPAVVYGENKEPTLVQVDGKNYEKVMRTHHGQSVLFHLNVIEGEKVLRDYSAMLKQEQKHPVSGSIIHIDFQRVDVNKEIEATVPLESTGEAIGVKRDGGSLEHVLWELHVLCSPRHLPEKIRVDVSNLGLGDAIHVSDIQIPDGVKVKNDPSTIAFTVVRSMKEAEEEVKDERSEPEVTKEKPKEAAAPAKEGKK